MKALLEIAPDDTEEDSKLLFLIDMASDWMEELLDRPFLRKVRTEYYSGTGTQKLPLRCRPVYSPETIQVTVNETGYFGSNPNTSGESILTYGGNNGFALVIDQDDGSSRSGILLRIGQYWNRPNIRTGGLLSPFLGYGMGNIKVVYEAGYTIDALPAGLRMGMAFLIARLRYLLPVGMELSGDSYEEKNYSFAASQKQYLMGLVWPMVMPYKNWSFGGAGR